MKKYVKFVSQADVIAKYSKLGELVPPSFVFTPFVVRDGVEGYLVDCDQNDENAELYSRDTSIYDTDPKVTRQEIELIRAGIPTLERAISDMPESVKTKIRKLIGEEISDREFKAAIFEDIDGQID